MAVEHYGQIFKCKVCGNKVEVLDAGGGTLVCCGKEMQEIGEEQSQSPLNIVDSGG